MGDVLSEGGDPPGQRTDQTGDGRDRRRLARADVAQERDRLTLADRQRQAAEGLHAPVVDDEVLDLHGEVRNFTSMLRVVCAVHLGQIGRERPEPAALPARLAEVFA